MRYEGRGYYPNTLTYGHSLLFSSTQHIHPVLGTEKSLDSTVLVYTSGHATHTPTHTHTHTHLHSFPATLSLQQIRQMHLEYIVGNERM